MTDARDREAILAHVHSIFAAFIARDRAALRRTHSDDWIGFLGPSTSIERGIETYMRNAENSLQTFRGTGYELHETEIRFFGDLAVLFYVARYDYEGSDGQSGSLPLRAIDLYRRDGDDWIQCGSHITPIPSGVWGAES